MKKKHSSHIKNMLYVLLLPLLFIGILFSRFFDKMDEKNTSSHYSRLDILAHYCPIYRVAVGSEKTFWTK
ncbi:hypothetical protein [uncultured Capnocytophaga sp.]|uniref:hypothetical protein n=1 Tax=uncultured Capnocytophaga sp. TaxID=159273 RepID=UPI0026060045|nr:hypothetical protein [uncultured Capnocytophaga sp.]